MKNRSGMHVALCSMSVCAVLLATAGDPQVANVSTADTAGNVISVSYRLTGAPAVVTFTVETNAGEGAWMKVPDSATACSWGDVSKLVQPDAETDKVFWWRPDACWQGIKVTDASVRLRVTAWPTNNPPDYMACDLTLTNFVRYYVSAEAVPGGVTNDIYKTDRLLMRRIPATGVEWRMGRGWTELKSFDPTMNPYTIPCNVVLSKDYYIGVYETTQRQYYLFTNKQAPSNFSVANGYSDCDRRPVENIWLSDTNKNVDNYNTVNSYLPTLRAITGVDFKLPSEAQWEFACRAGATEAFYNGSNELSAADAIAWHKGNSAVDGVQQTHVVGMKKPNAFGLYDMIGNVWEVCRDWYKEDPYGGADQIDPEVTAAQTYHVRKGGSWFATCTQWCNTSGRYKCYSDTKGWWGLADCVGFRLSCDAVAVK